MQLPEILGSPQVPRSGRESASVAAGMGLYTPIHPADMVRVD